MHKDINRRANLLPDDRHRQIGSTEYHRFQTADHIPGTVRMPRAEAAVMAGIHRLKHIEAFRAPNLAHHNAVRPHPQRGTDQITDTDLPPAFRIRISRLQRNEIRYGDDLQLG
ncbi:hypothetical protein D3C74_400480 [compost metagenome]